MSIIYRVIIARANIIHDLRISSTRDDATRVDASPSIRSSSPPPPPTSSFSGSTSLTHSLLQAGLAQSVKGSAATTRSMVRSRLCANEGFDRPLDSTKLRNESELRSNA
ncbi:hypothetical protein RB195_003949 [Necator americanus]|uniref:Uncharacterized protein n=1 Tax=Necator americanus TaxID=51031 RepID=A0ABR1DRQ9_NECAM